MPDGSWRVECIDQVDRCVRQASRVCGERDYEIVGGGKKTKVYGGSTGVQTASEVHTLFVHCAGAPERSSAPPEGAEPKAMADAETPAPAAPREHEKPAAPVCAPGSTQRCVGPGACQGGQSCKGDGSGFLPCDCGDRAPAVNPPAGPVDGPDA